MMYTFKDNNSVMFIFGFLLNGDQLLRKELASREQLGANSFLKSWSPFKKGFLFLGSKCEFRNAVPLL